MIRTALDFDGIKHLLDDVADRQIPYATSRALNDTALGVQEGERAGISKRFTLRRPEWILQGVKIPKFTNKNDTPMEISIVMDDGAGRGDIMSKFEEGGAKVPRQANSISVPIDARPSKNQIIPKGLRPKSLNLHAVGRSVRGDQGTFILPTRSGKRGIFQRTAKGDIRLLYWLTPSVTLPASLHFMDTAHPIIQELWEINFAARFEEAKRSAR